MFVCVVTTNQPDTPLFFNCLNTRFGYNSNIDNESQRYENFNSVVNGSLNDGPFNLVYSSEVKGIPYPLASTDKTKNYERCISSIVITNATTGYIYLIGYTIDNIYVRTRNKLALHLKNCDVRNLHIQPASDVNAKPIEILIEKSNIGTLTIDNNRKLGKLHIESSSILNIICPPTWSNNPFTGSVLFKNIWLPRKSNILMESPQNLINLRSHINKIENQSSANIVHSAVLSMERKGEAPMALS